MYNRQSIVLLTLLLLSAQLSCSVFEASKEIPQENTVERIIIIPDLQYYTNDEGRYKYLESIIGFLKEETESKNPICIQVGDLTYQNSLEQWNIVDSLFLSNIPNSMPFVYCLGNHDYGINGRSSERISNIPESLYPVRDIVMTGDVLENYARFFDFAGGKCAVLVLEFAPRDIALDWANDVIRAYHDIPFIILTHAFLNNEGELFDSSNPDCDNTFSQKSYRLGGDCLNDSMEIFNKIIAKNDNVRMVICGHCVSKKYIEYKTIKNAKDEDVHCIMVNYQHFPEGGRGNIGLLDYYKGRFILRPYSTYNKKFGDVLFQFFF